MTLRAATRLGIAGLAIPLAMLPAQFVVATVAGWRMADIPANWDPLMVAQAYLAPLALIAFLVVLYRVSAGSTVPSRLSDAAMASSILMIVSLAVRLPWPLTLWFSHGHFSYAWLPGTHWILAGILEPVAWLALLVSFVRQPEVPLSRASRRAAARLAGVLLLGAVWPVVRFAQTLVIFYWDFPPRPNSAYYAWIGVVSGFIEVLGWLLQLLFAAALWRIGPGAPPSAESASIPAPVTD